MVPFKLMVKLMAT